MGNEVCLVSNFEIIMLKNITCVQFIFSLLIQYVVFNRHLNAAMILICSLFLWAFVFTEKSCLNTKSLMFN